MIKEAQAYANGILPEAEGDAARAVQEAEAYKSQVVPHGDRRCLALHAARRRPTRRRPNVTRERLYIETVESVLKRSRKVIIDSKSGNGNMLYLPLDKLMERSRESDANTVTVRPPVSVEAGSGARPTHANGWNADGLAHSRQSWCCCWR